MMVMNIGIRRDGGRHHDRQRAGRRANCNIPASIKYDGLLICTCSIVDVSDSGLRLSVPSRIRPPKDFYVEAEIFDGPVKVRTIWASETQVGVSFAINWSDIRQTLGFENAA